MPVAIDKPSKYFNTTTHTGDSAEPRSFTGVGFKPDWVWAKSRSATWSHVTYDSVRGVQKSLYQNLTNAEDTSVHALTSFDTDGFTTGYQANINYSGDTYVVWNWLAGGTGVSNTSGTISSTVSANTTSGFSIVSYTGTGANATVGHGLGVAPKMIIVKRRDSTANWFVYHASIGNNGYVMLNLSDAKDQPNSTVWNNTSPTSSLFSLGTSSGINASGGTYIAYCFADVKGYSKFGSRTGNGSLDGDFVYTGFKPAFVMTKRSDGVDNWRLHDNKRNTFNVVNNQLLADSSNTENTNTFMDLLSNGFKYRLDGGINTSGGQYIYMAFAENPFVSSKGIPTTAR